MPVQRREWNFYPDIIRTRINDRESFITGDALFEPEQSQFLRGYIGRTAELSREDLQRLPLITESTPQRQKYQLRVGGVYVDPVRQIYSSGVFYDDILGHLQANGALIDDPNRLFGTSYYAWTPPIDYDKHINRSRYFWTGPGSRTTASYVVKEPAGSQTVLYEVTSNGLIKRDVRIVTALPSNSNPGDLVEVARANRLIYQWNGGWVAVAFIVVDGLPTDITPYALGQFLYVCQTGSEFNRPLCQTYARAAGRWLAQPVCVRQTPPDTPRPGMLWEDVSEPPYRIIRRYTGGTWVAAEWTAQTQMPGQPGLDGQTLYDCRRIDRVDQWSRRNWWRHYEDLSPADRARRGSRDRAIRPIVELWGGLEVVGQTMEGFPLFQIYAYRPTVGDIQPLTTNFFSNPQGGTSTIFQYQVGEGIADRVLGFIPTYDSGGQFQFEVTLETTTIRVNGEPLLGYRFYHDVNSGFVHRIWEKRTTPTVQSADSNGLYRIPDQIIRNPDHGIQTVVSRSTYLNHMSRVVGRQVRFEGSRLGLNSYRWTEKNPTVGAILIDCEQTLLRMMGRLQQSQLNLPDTIRWVAREYNRTCFKFINRLSQMWDGLVLNDAAGNLMVEVSEACNIVLTDIFIGRNDQFPFYYRGMGQYVQTQIADYTVSVIDPHPQPIFIPSSPSLLGIIPTYQPRSFVDPDGRIVLRGHDGSCIPSFGDRRDAIWLELQNRFFQRVQPNYRTETQTASTRHMPTNFFLGDVVGNLTPQTPIVPVNQVVADYTAISNPTGGLRVFRTQQGVYANYRGQWLTETAQVDDIFLNETDQIYYCFNGLGLFPIALYNRRYDFAYRWSDYRGIIRRDFERWSNASALNFSDNTTFDPNDPFRWNYRSAGIEGNYRGIYARIYNRIRPHRHPWEVVGYRIEPRWWRTTYVPRSVQADGTPRYSANHSMWADLHAGIYDGVHADAEFAMMAPTPVDSDGNLLDPIGAGVVDSNRLDMTRINDAWVFGDGGPVEQQFYRSPYYGFAQSLAGYLMKPALWIDLFWSQTTIAIGSVGPNILWNAPTIINTATLTRQPVRDQILHLEVVNGRTTVRLGTNAWIAERIRAGGGDPTDSFGQIIRNTEPHLGWNCAGFINAARTTMTTLRAIQIPFEDIHTVLHVRQPQGEYFCSGVAVVRSGRGYRVYGYDLLNPYFTIDTAAAPQRGGQVVLTDTIRATQDQHTFTTTLTLPQNVNANETASLGIMVNGMLLKPQHVTIENANTFEIESYIIINAGDTITVSVTTTVGNPRTQIRRFIIDGVRFPYLAKGTGVIQTVPYGQYYDSSPEVINFMLGYQRWLVRQGWVFDYADPQTGTVQDWMAGAQSFANWVLQTRKPWTPQSSIPITEINEFYFRPIAARAKLSLDFGQIARVEQVQYGFYGVIDQTAAPIDPDRLETTRIADTMTITSSVPMYGSRMFAQAYSHAVWLSNQTKFNDIIYDPVGAAYQDTLRVDSYRTTVWNGRFEADGFIINEGRVLPNFEKQAFDFTRFYDRFNPPDDPQFRDQARNLYGWQPNSAYMEPIGADDRSCFDYFRGMIHAKGTVRAVYAYTRGTRIGANNVEIHEDWAWKLQEFGDRRRERVQFQINHDDFQKQIQVIRFTDSTSNVAEDILVAGFNRTQIDPNRRWILPPTLGDNRNNNLIFPTDLNGLPRVRTTRFSCSMFDTVTDETVVRLFHWDPQLGLHEPRAQRQVDWATPYDPARYTNGPGQMVRDELAWGSDQVGRIWWNTTNRLYANYRGVLPDYDHAAREWGRLLYFTVTLTLSGNTVTATTFDPYSGNTVPHGLRTGNRVQINGADQTAYNGTVSITVTAPTSFTYTIAANPAPQSPATGTIFVQIGSIDVYEWVQSPVPPFQWANYVRTLTDPTSPSGTALNVSNASYVRRSQINSNGIAVPVYYFWVTQNTGLNRVKSLTTATIARNLESPTAANLAWFAPIDRTDMICFMDGSTVQDGYALDVLVDQRDQETHVEWVLLREGDDFYRVPQEIVDKIVDCLCGVDRFGTAVPSNLLGSGEIYGNDTVPTQTIFQDVEAALAVYTTTINRILRTYDLGRTVGNLTRLIPSRTQGIYWEKAAWIDPSVRGKAVYDTTATFSVRDQRRQQKRYAVGDLVYVEQSDQTDPWTNQTVGATYLWDGSAFRMVGVDAATIAVIAPTDSRQFRYIFRTTYGFLQRIDQNALIFAILYEMLHQNAICDWFFKTSYVRTHMTVRVGQPAYTPPDEVRAIIANFNDVKPYRTKLRQNTLTYNITPEENFAVSIEESPDIKIGIRFDRLTCNMGEDGGWDRFPWDRGWAGWDAPFWTFDNLGQNVWYIVGEQSGDNHSTQFTFQPYFDPTLYGQRVNLLQNGQVVDAAAIGITTTIRTTHTAVIVFVNTPLPPTFTVQLEAAVGLYLGPLPVLPTDLTTTTLFQPLPLTYEHAVARSYVPDVFDPQTEMAGCRIDRNDPEERISANVTDRVNICVRMEWTPALVGWGATPWGTTPWDQAPANVGPRVYMMRIGRPVRIPAQTIRLQTSEDVQAANLPWIIGTHPTYDVVQLSVGNNELTEGIQYTRSSGFKNVFEILDPIDIVEIADGIRSSFDASAATRGIAAVYVDEHLKVEDVDYIVQDNTLVFNPLPAVLVSSIASAQGTSYMVGDSIDFPTKQPAASLNPSNCFVFINGLLQSVRSYAVVNDAIEFTSTPRVGESVRMLCWGNDFGDHDRLFRISRFTGNGSTITYEVGAAADTNRTFVFVNGLYQVNRVDYTVGGGVVTFTAAPSRGAEIEIRVLNPTTYVRLDWVHLVLTARGTSTDTITGISGADPTTMMVFVQHTLQDGWTETGHPTYLLRRTSPNQIKWIGTPPTAGTKITVRLFRSITVRQTRSFQVYPIKGQTVRIVPQPYLRRTDIVTLLYNGWPVGPLGPFQILSAPSDWTIRHGILTLNRNPPSDGEIVVEYKQPHRGNLIRARLVRMPIILDDMLANYQSYDGTLGFQTNRPTGYTVVDTTANKYYQWDGQEWNETTTVKQGDEFFVKRLQQIIQYTGSRYDRLFELGQTDRIPDEIFGWTDFGIGQTWGTYALGQTANARSDFPIAYNIIQHGGDC